MSRDCPSKKSCFQCGSPDHMRFNCPQLKKGGSVQFGSRPGSKGEEKRSEPARPKGRAFHMIAAKAEEIPDVVTSTFLVNSLCVKVLFDSGANRSFVSHDFMKC